MLKIKDNIDLKELEKYGYETFYLEHKKSTYAVKDIYIDRPNKITPDWYRIVVDEVNRKFRKSKSRAGKTLLDVKVAKKDLDDLIKADLVEKVEEE